MKFSFINPGPNTKLSARERKKMFGASPPLGIFYVATILQHEGIDVSILDQAAKGLTMEDTLRWIRVSFLAIPSRRVSLWKFAPPAFLSKYKLWFLGCQIELGDDHSGSNSRQDTQMRQKSARPLPICHQKCLKSSNFAYGCGKERFGFLEEKEAPLASLFLASSMMT